MKRLMTAAAVLAAVVACSGCFTAHGVAKHNATTAEHARAIQLMPQQGGVAVGVNLSDLPGYIGAWAEDPLGMAGNTAGDAALLGAGTWGGYEIGKSAGWWGGSSSTAPAAEPAKTQPATQGDGSTAIYLDHINAPVTIQVNGGSRNQAAPSARLKK